MKSLPESMCLLNCRECGHVDDFFAFKSTPITGELPMDTFQCPACRKAWRMEAQDKGRHYECGLYVPPTRKAVAVPTIL